MHFYLVHERHGFKIAYFQSEADLDKKAGWKEVSKDEYFDKLTGGAKEPEIKEDDELLALRELLTENGVAVDKRWKRKRLEEELEKLNGNG